MKQAGTIGTLLLGAVLAVVLMGMAVQLWSVHQTTSDWALWPKAVPSRVQFADRDYQCGPDPAPSGRSTDGLAKHGITAGGGDIYAPPAGGTATWIVVAADGATYTCNLLGGP